MIEHHASLIAKSLLGEPNERFSKGSELRWGNFGSLSVDLSKGTYFDHEVGSGGGLVDLIRREGKDPMTYLTELGIEGEKPQPPSGPRIVAQYTYFNKVGEEVYQVCRYEPKTFRPRRKTSSGYVMGLSGITPLPYNLPEILTQAEKPIFIVEGEKDVDRLGQIGFLATCNSGGAGNWNKALNEYFIDRDIVIIPDCDEAGEKHLKTVASNLQGIARAIKVLRLPIKDKEDISDWLDGGGNATQLTNLAKQAELLTENVEAPAPFKSWVVMSALTIPPRDFIYGNHFIRKFVSITASQGGLGKSTAILTECIAMATGRDLLGVQPKAKSKCVYYNAEDPMDEIQRRVIACCVHFGIDQNELVDQLFIASGRDSDLLLAEGYEGLIKEDTFDKLESFCTEYSIDVLALDPLANMTSGSGETNEIFREISRRLSMLADKVGKGLSIHLVHHTRKLNGMGAQDADAVRGGSSLIAAVRAARLFNGMTAEEATKAGLETHTNHFRVDDAKNNLSKPSEKAQWFERISVQLDNSDSVAVVIPWEFPDAFTGVTNEQARRSQQRINDERPRLHPSSSNWAGKIVAEELELDISDKFNKARVSTILKGWIKTKVLAIDEEHDPRQGREIKIVVSGDNKIERS